MAGKKRSVWAAVRRNLLVDIGLILIWVGIILWVLAGTGVLGQPGDLVFNPFVMAGAIIMSAGALLWACLYFYHEFYKITD